uniref:UPAR/Ly6 domain-containing protein n=1 Tax=Panagrolaimus sp. PS1159 TaxID=55785 RepID=A0AC35FWH3_9BILA
MHFFAAFLLLSLGTIVSSKITCYRGMNIIMPGNANFNQSMASIGCNNANYCVRSFGKFFGKDGYFSTCGNDETCKSYPNCTTVTGGSNDYVTNYTSCCCNTTLCNDLSFTGGIVQTKDTTASAEIIGTSIVFFCLIPMLSYFLVI